MSQLSDLTPEAAEKVKEAVKVLQAAGIVTNFQLNEKITVVESQVDRVWSELRDLRAMIDHTVLLFASAAILAGGTVVVQLILEFWKVK